MQQSAKVCAAIAARRALCKCFDKQLNWATKSQQCHQVKTVLWRSTVFLYTQQRSEKSGYNELCDAEVEELWRGCSGVSIMRTNLPFKHGIWTILTYSASQRYVNTGESAYVRRTNAVVQLSFVGCGCWRCCCFYRCFCIEFFIFAFVLSLAFVYFVFYNVMRRVAQCQRLMDSRPQQ